MRECRYGQTISDSRVTSVNRNGGGDVTTFREPALQESHAVIWSTFQSRNYRIWYPVQLLTLCSNWLFMVGANWVLYEKTLSSAALGMLTFAMMIPSAVCMLPAGVVIDRASRKRVLQYVQAVLLLQGGTLTYLAATGALAVIHLFGFAVIFGVANAFYAPARHAFVADLINDRSHLPQAVAFNSLAFNLARIGGPAIGGVLLAYGGPTGCFGVYTAGMALALVGLRWIRFPWTADRPPETSLWTSLREGLRFAWRHRRVRYLLAWVVGSALFGAGNLSLLPAYAAEILHYGASGYGGMYTLIGVGAMFGALGVAGTYRRIHRPVRWIQIGVALIPLGMSGLGMRPSVPVVFVLLILIGLGFAIQFALTNSTIQMTVQDRMRGRIMSLYTLLFFGTTALGGAMAGHMAAIMGIPRWLILSGGFGLFLQGWIRMGLRHASVEGTEI